MTKKTKTPAAPKDKPTKAEDEGLLRFQRQQTMFLSPEERVVDAYRAGFRAGRLEESGKWTKVLKKLGVACG